MKSNDEMDLVRATALALHKKLLTGGGRNSGRVRLTTTLWVLLALRNAAVYARKHGGLIADRYNISIIRQMRHMIRLGIFDNIAAKDYYTYGMYKEKNLRNARFYISHHEIIRLLPVLESRVAETVRDKYEYFRHCLKHGLATPPVIAYFEEGHDILTLNSLPDADLFSKVTDSWGGQGVIRWEFLKEQRRWTSNNLMMSEDKLIQWFRDESRRGPIVLQERVYNHPEIADITQGGLVICRIVSAIDHEGEVQLITAAMKAPRAKAHIDHFHAGGVAAGVDLTSGIMTAAISKEVGSDVYVNHPDTGARIEGRRLPVWDETKALVRKAHKTFPEQTFIGWDVSWDSDGPILIEANIIWGGEVIQVANDFPLGLTQFPRLYLNALNRWDRTQNLTTVSAEP